MLHPLVFHPKGGPAGRDGIGKLESVVPGRHSNHVFLGRRFGGAVVRVSVRRRSLLAVRRPARRESRDGHQDPESSNKASIAHASSSSFCAIYRLLALPIGRAIRRASLSSRLLITICFTSIRITSPDPCTVTVLVTRVRANAQSPTTWISTGSISIAASCLNLRWPVRLPGSGARN